MASKSIDHITIKGFKSIASIENLKLRPINVVIGANGAGKSNFISVFAFLRAIWQDRLEYYVEKSGGAERLLHFGAKTTKAIVLRLQFSNATEFFDLRLEPDLGDTLIRADESTSLAEPLERVGEQFAGWPIYQLHDPSPSSPMRKTPKVDDNRFLRSDGANLAAFLYYLRERHQDSYDLIRKTVRQVVPFFQDFILQPRGLESEYIRLEWKHQRSDQYFDASLMSDGTLSFIALAALFLQPKQLRPPVILVDEPELGLHPYAIGVLASLIQMSAIDNQVIVATQSPILLDYFEPEDVLVADCVDGATKLTRLDPERLARWLEDYSLGELWEKNEIGGRPGSY
jgi:predicted ATPase